MADSTTSQKKRATVAPRGLWLISAETGFPYAPLYPPTPRFLQDNTVDLSDPSLPWHLDIGYFTEHKIAGVRYTYNGTTATATKPPYRLLDYKPAPLPVDAPDGHHPPHIDVPDFSGTFPPGRYTIIAEPYTDKEGTECGPRITVNLTTIQSIVSKIDDTQQGDDYDITPFTVTNQGTSPVSLYGPHLYSSGKHILAQGSPPLEFGCPLDEEFTVPGNNINFVTSFSFRADDKGLHACTTQAFEHPGGSPFVLQPGQSLNLQLVEPIKKPKGPQHAWGGVGGGSGPGKGKPPVP